MDSFEFDLAKQFCQRALETQADSTRALETMGTIHLELADLEAAKQCFSQCVELEPETGYSKYMYLGQLLTSKESVTAFLKGIELMKKCLMETKQVGVPVCTGTSYNSIVAQNVAIACSMSAPLARYSFLDRYICI